MNQLFKIHFLFGILGGSPEMIGDIIRDLQCVFGKTFQDSKNMEAKYSCLLVT